MELLRSTYKRRKFSISEELNYSDFEKYLNCIIELPIERLKEIPGIFVLNSDGIPDEKTGTTIGSDIISLLNAEVSSQRLKLYYPEYNREKQDYSKSHPYFQSSTRIPLGLPVEDYLDVMGQLFGIGANEFTEPPQTIPNTKLEVSDNDIGSTASDIVNIEAYLSGDQYNENINQKLLEYIDSENDVKPKKAKNTAFPKKQKKVFAPTKVNQQVNKKIVTSKWLKNDPNKSAPVASKTSNILPRQSTIIGKTQIKNVSEQPSQRLDDSIYIRSTDRRKSSSNSRPVDIKKSINHRKVRGDSDEHQHHIYVVSLAPCDNTSLNFKNSLSIIPTNESIRNSSASNDYSQSRLLNICNRDEKLSPSLQSGSKWNSNMCIITDADSPRLILNDKDNLPYNTSSTRLIKNSAGTSSNFGSIQQAENGAYIQNMGNDLPKTCSAISTSPNPSLKHPEGFGENLIPKLNAAGSRRASASTHIDRRTPFDSKIDASRRASHSPFSSKVDAAISSNEINFIGSPISLKHSMVPENASQTIIEDSLRASYSRNIQRKSSFKSELAFEEILETRSGRASIAMPTSIATFNSNVSEYDGLPSIKKLPDERKYSSRVNSIDFGNTEYLHVPIKLELPRISSATWTNDFLISVKRECEDDEIIKSTSDLVEVLIINNERVRSRISTLKKSELESERPIRQ